MMVSTKNLGSSSCPNFLFCDLQAANLQGLLFNLPLPLPWVFGQPALPSLLRDYTWGSLNCGCMGAGFAWPTLATKHHCQMPSELGETFWLTWGLQHTIKSLLHNKGLSIYEEIGSWAAHWPLVRIPASWLLFFGLVFVICLQMCLWTCSFSGPNCRSH